MATDTYLINRKRYQRPQALCFADNPGIISGGKPVPDGTEFSNFIILSDHNRASIQIGPERIGAKERGINGRMRSYWIADKLSISTSWENLPSRGWFGTPALDPDGKSLLDRGEYFKQFTADGGAGGNELLEWYKGHVGSFWVYLAYDRYPVQNAYDKLGQYNEVVEMFFDDFSYEVVKRGGQRDYGDPSKVHGMDLWNIDIKLVEA